MAISPVINATIYDISRDTPRDEDIFMVDTNVWFWLTYTKGIPPKRQYLNIYPTYIGNCLAAGSTLHHSGLTLSELSHLIEKTEREIFQLTLGNMVSAKEYRHNYPAERQNAVSEIEVSWQQVESFASQIELNVCKEVTDSCISSIKALGLDGYDLMIVDSMKNHNITNIITDDIDYCTIPGINVYTANRNLLQLASQQSKIKTR
ncbi:MULTISPECIES: PIN domain-containing protein [Enterobacteriaceae]|uniref:PIN domain-containing protein n=1 Tax=Enterobacteriaceae TaxID=543 RepID=UPI001B33C590|nr:MULTISPECIES: PIN domain-containing protein [Enterobacteriaceae]HDV8181091.1 PIN domain-containing protein [Enterobacter hormaechei]HDW2117902.1 PIN domain-containing protein [Enterobacter hormaechei subsp. xiangfangensis]MBP4006521.1 PIN domain-containing protein [Escherichia coli]WGL82933.1 PIN domain-containing protein [Enterobacter cloacae]HDV8189479.1 PIN domain-containing protein [Enterobacter hormaechei]